MDARFYNSEEIDIERLANDLVSAYQIQGYQAQQIGNKDQILVQLKKGGDFEAIIGMQAALSLTIQRTTGGVLAMVGQQRWLDKAAVGAVGIVALPVLWPLALTAGVGALRQASLGNQVLNMVDGLVRQQRPGIQAGPIPYQIMPQLQQQQLPPPSSQPYYVPSAQVVPTAPPPQPQPIPAPAPQPAVQKELRCTNCNTPYEQGDTFCTGCGRSLTPPRLYCSNCNSEIKQGASFCPKCGASTFTTVSAAQQTLQPRPAPVTPTPRVTYTPAPTPPPAPTPVYTPPPRPQTPVYTPSNVEPYAAPTVPVPQPPPAPPKQPEVYYVPPVTQEPKVQPQPTVSYVQQTPKQETPPPPKQPEVYYVPPTTQEPTVQPQPTVNYVQSTPKPDATPTPPQPQQEKVYYTPPPHLQQANLAQSANPAQPVKPKVQTPAQQPPAPRPIAARPASKPATDPNAVWGTLTFSDGTVTQLKGESVSVGRYDHDLGGIQPDVDLAKMEGADTVSRIHAAIEHIGSTYTLTDLNSTNSTRLNNKRLEPDKATPINDGDALSFGKVTCTFKKS